MEEKIEQALRLLAMDIRDYMSQEKWVTEAKRALYPIIFSNQVKAGVKPACEFTDKQLGIIGLAVKKWLIEDTFINCNGKHGAHFIDKKNGSPTLRDRLLEMSKSV